MISLAFTINTILLINFHPELSLIYYDTLIVVVLSTLISLLALRRPSDFFIHHLQEDPDIPLHKKFASLEEYIAGGIPYSNDEDHFYNKDVFL